MRLAIEVELGNAAFADDMAGEVRRVLGVVADYVDEHGLSDDSLGQMVKTLRDVNGNSVGCFNVFEN